MVCFLLDGNNFPAFIFTEGRFPLISTAWPVLLLVGGTLFQGGKLLRRNESCELSCLIHQLSGALHLSRAGVRLRENLQKTGGRGRCVTRSHESGSLEKCEGNSRVPSWRLDPNKSPELTLPSSERGIGPGLNRLSRLYYGCCSSGLNEKVRTKPSAFLHHLNMAIFSVFTVFSYKFTFNCS